MSYQVFITTIYKAMAGDMYIKGDGKVTQDQISHLPLESASISALQEPHNKGSSYCQEPDNELTAVAP
jgi:hypothetical protein